MIRTRTALWARLAIGLAALACAAPAAQAQEAAVTKRATELREAPGDTGRSLAALPAQTPLTRMNERKGPWVQVKTEAGQTGWLHLFDVGPASGAANTQAGGGSGTGSNVLRNVTGLFSKGSTTSTSASGIRGVTAEDIANAQPNPAAVNQMEALRQTEDQARRFASGAAIAAVSVEPLPAPARPAAASGRSGAPGNPDSQ
jgi:hypothetical protein